MRIGLSIYALLGGMGPDTRFQMVSRNEWGSLDGLETAGLQAVFRYYDGHTDDAALTRAVVRSAENLGAEVLTCATFAGAELREDGVKVNFLHKDQERFCKAKVLINAAGPWVNGVLEKIQPAMAGLPVDLVQGTHIILAGNVEEGIYYVEAPRDRRAVFVMPWKGRLLVGTTETPFVGEPEGSRPLQKEVDYLLETLSHYFPRYRSIGREDVLEFFAGLRVLPTGKGAAFGRSRETILHVDRDARPRVLSIYGGKLTAYRATAEKVLRRVAASLPVRPPAADTKELSLEDVKG